MAGMREGEWPYLLKKLFCVYFFSYNLALSEKKCNFVGDIQLKEKIMATLTDVDAEAIRQRLVVKESLTIRKCSWLTIMTTSPTH